MPVAGNRNRPPQKKIAETVGNAAPFQNRTHNRGITRRIQSLGIIKLRTREFEVDKFLDKGGRERWRFKEPREC
jgi:hypothetical protein